MPRPSRRTQTAADDAKSVKGDAQEVKAEQEALEAMPDGEEKEAAKAKLEEDANEEVKGDAEIDKVVSGHLVVHLRYISI
jgi:hypothetical protein